MGDRVRPIQLWLPWPESDADPASREIPLGPLGHLPKAPLGDPAYERYGLGPIVDLRRFGRFR